MPAVGPPIGTRVASRSAGALQAPIWHAAMLAASNPRSDKPHWQLAHIPFDAARSKLFAENPATTIAAAHLFAV
jgi:hypothetical protein